MRFEVKIKNNVVNLDWCNVNDYINQLVEAGFTFDDIDKEKYYCDWNAVMFNSQFIEVNELSDIFKFNKITDNIEIDFKYKEIILGA